MNPRYLVLVLLAGAVAAGPDSAPKPADLEASVAKGVAWLRSLAKDGVFVVKVEDKEYPNPGYTALALSAIAGSLPPDARAKDPLVQSCSDFLVKSMREDGGIGAEGKYDNYFTSATLMALVTVGDPATAAAREKMKNFLLTLQRMDDARLRGGFGYNSAKGADLSNAQFAIAALRAAGLPEDHEAMVRARAFLARAQNRSENEENKDASYELEEKGIGIVKVVPGNDGSAGYEPGVSKAGLEKLPDGTYVARGYGSMTYALLKCYLLAGVDRDDERVKAAVKWLAQHYTWEENPGFTKAAEETGQKEAPYWGLFYYYMTAAKALQLIGLEKLETPAGPRDWKADLSNAILSRQQADGSWRNDRSPRWEEGDPLLCTAYAVIALEDILGAK
ncbi:MAG: terpene cyclase/mutase family protein [Planctomycetes bacterium]|nr:terpene cyclase/mutase family protein [Planctomycetota bacterium]